MSKKKPFNKTVIVGGQPKVDAPNDDALLSSVELTGSVTVGGVLDANFKGTGPFKDVIVVTAIAVHNMLNKAAENALSSKTSPFTHGACNIATVEDEFFTMFINAYSRIRAKEAELNGLPPPEKPSVIIK